MIVASRGGYRVKSEDGKNLSKPGLSKKAAERRLQQVEYFKALLRGISLDGRRRPRLPGNEHRGKTAATRGR